MALLRTALLTLLLFLGSLHAADYDGLVTALQGRATLFRGQSAEPLKLGARLLEKDRIETKERSRVQIRMKDGTVLTMGADSRLTIRRYDYDGTADSEATFGMTEGFFRSITGKIGKIAPKRFHLETANATIGIRGTEIAIQASPAKGDRIACIRGAIFVASLFDKSHAELRAGQMVFVAPGGKVGEPTDLDETQMAISSDDVDIPARSNAFYYADEGLENLQRRSVSKEVEEAGFTPPPETPPSDPDHVYKIHEFPDIAYLDFGYWTDADRKVTDTYLDATEADRTPASTIDDYIVRRVTGRYEGSVVAITPNGHSDGTVGLDIDFGNRSFTGTMGFGGQGGVQRWEMEMSGTVDNQGIKADTFQTTENSDARNIRGNFQGKFYGPNAESVGGSFDLQSDSGRAKGHFGAAKQ
ncbi:FecR domain-containing protein [Hydrogenimonas sp.]